MITAPNAPAPNLVLTPILDYEHPAVQAVVATFRTMQPPRAQLQAAHRHLATTIGPVYTVDDVQPVSVTLQKGRGSCSQRMACLEAIARANGIGTRVRALWVDGRFWYPRFRLSRPFIPRRILLTWPQFWLDGAWVDFDELYAPTADLLARADHGFTNSGETLFEAVAHTPVDFLGKSRSCTGAVGCTATQADLSRFIVADAGCFDTRDDVFARFGSLHATWPGRAFELIFGGHKSV